MLYDRLLAAGVYSLSVRYQFITITNLLNQSIAVSEKNTIHFILFIDMDYFLIFKRVYGGCRKKLASADCLPYP